MSKAGLTIFAIWGQVTTAMKCASIHQLRKQWSVSALCRILGVGTLPDASEAIDHFYYTVRRHNALGNQSPLAFELRTADQKTKALI